jgi:hypothetical protein
MTLDQLPPALRRDFDFLCRAHNPSRSYGSSLEFKEFVRQEMSELLLTRLSKNTSILSDEEWRELMTNIVLINAVKL